MLNGLKIAGWQKVSLIDYPGKVASVLFLAGCNMRCHYCQNRHILDTKQNQIPVIQVLKGLGRRRAWIDAVVVSGGEPTVYAGLLELLRALKQLHLQIKLDTNGTRPDVVRKAIELGLVDYVALDVKAPPNKYKEITGMSAGEVFKTAQYLQRQNSVPYLFRTTLSPLLSQNDLLEIAKVFVIDGTLWQIQPCRCIGAYTTAEMLKIVKNLKMHYPNVVVRNM